MISFLPMEESSLDRSPNLSKWIGVWASTLGKEVEVLDPNGCFERGHDQNGEEINVDGV